MGGKSSKEVVKETVSDIKDQQELIDQINELYEKLRGRFDDDYKKLEDAIVIFKHENFSFQFTTVDNIGGIVDSVSAGLQTLKPKAKEAKSEEPSKYTDMQLQDLIDGNIGSALDQLTELFVMIAPQLGSRSGTSYEWSTDMRLISANMFLYNAAFLYRFENTHWFSKKKVVAVGYFSYIFQSNKFADNFLELRRRLYLLSNFDDMEKSLLTAQRYLNKRLEKAMEDDNDDEMAVIEKWQAIVDKKRTELLGDVA